jgi:hypothetical protein
VPCVCVRTDPEYWTGWLATEAKRRGARGWTLREEASGTLLGYGMFTASSWEWRNGALPAATPPPELQLVDFGCLATAEPEVQRVLQCLGRAAAQAGPGCDVVCVVPAPLLPTRASAEGAPLRVDSGWFYRVEGDGEGGATTRSGQVEAPPLDARRHVVWTLDKF